MAWFIRLEGPVAPNVSADAKDIINAKMALNNLGYYERPSNGKFGGWVDTGMFDAIRSFQQDNDLDVDGVMRPGGPTEMEINRYLAAAAGELTDPGDKMPITIPPNVDPGMSTTIKPPARPTSPPYIDEHGNIILEGRNPKTGLPVQPPRKI